MNGFRILPLLVCGALLWAEGVEAGQSGDSILELEADAGEDTVADEPLETSKETEARAPKALAVGATIVPGVLVHGAGSWVDGDSETAMRLLEMEGAGLGLILAGGVPIALTGASRYIIGPAAAVTIVGFGLFTVSWVADVYAVTAPEGGWGRPRSVTPWLETEVGYRYVYDPRFDYRHLVVNRIDLRHGPFRLSPSAWGSMGANNTRLRLLGGYRVFGPMATASSRVSDGSALDLEAAGTRHGYGDDAFAIDTLELFVRSRTDLQRVAKPLEGSFLELGLGGAIQRYTYDLPGQSIDSDLETMLLGRFGFGVYVGGPRAPDGEFLLYYDHRHDDYAAGLLSTLPLSGVAGHFGMDGRMFFDDNWGISAQGQIGSAFLGGVSLLFREYRR